MSAELSGKKIAFLVANEGIEQVELTKPWQAVRGAGGEPVLVAPEPGKAQAMNHLDRADAFPVDMTTAQADPAEFDGVVLPGGVANPDRLRSDPHAIRFLQDHARSGRPIATICHGPWTLVEAGLVEGRTVTSWPSLQTDIRNAGGRWVDEEVTVCHSGPSVIVSSRKPDDLKAFCGEMTKVFAATA